MVGAPFCYQLLSLRAHEDPRRKVFEYMSFEELVFVENEARAEAGHETIDAQRPPPWMRRQRSEARKGPGVFNDY